MARRARTLALALLAATVLAACASGDSTDQAASTPAGSTPAVPDLAGTSWDLTSYASAQGAQTPAVAAPSVSTLAFVDGGTIAGSTGCNRFTGTYQQAGAELTITTGALTQRACIGPAAEQEAALLAAFPEVAMAEVGTDSLVLKDSQGAELLVYAAGLDGLEGTSWTATGINNGKQAVVTDATTQTVTATFDSEAVLSGFGGCNTYTSTWTTTDPDGLTIGPVASSLKACEQAQTDTEQKYFAALGNVATYQIDGNQLTLRDAEGAVQVNFELATD